MIVSPHDGAGYDELFGDGGAVREPWSELAQDFTGGGPDSVRRLQSRIRLLVDNHGITYNPLDGSDAPTAPPRSTPPVTRSRPTWPARPRTT